MCLSICYDCVVACMCVCLNIQALMKKKEREREEEESWIECIKRARYQMILFASSCKLAIFQLLFLWRAIMLLAVFFFSVFYGSRPQDILSECCTFEQEI